MSLARSSFILTLLACVGCMPFPKRGDSNWSRMNPFTPAEAVPKAILRTALIDQPAGDHYLTNELWLSAVKPLPSSTAAILAENGIRVGVFAGTPPPEFLRLINDGSAVKPTDNSVNLGDAKAIAIQGPLPTLPLSLIPDLGATPQNRTLNEVECALAITGTPSLNDKMTVRVEPRIQHGARQGWLRPTVDGTGLSWKDGKEQERYSKLAFEIELAPHDYLIIGATETPGERLGGAFFLNQQPDRARMRLFVLRAWQMNPVKPAVPGSRPGSIAAQASVPVARGRLEQ